MYFPLFISLHWRGENPILEKPDLNRQGAWIFPLNQGFTVLISINYFVGHNFMEKLRVAYKLLTLKSFFTSSWEVPIAAFAFALGSCRFFKF